MRRIVPTSSNSRKFCAHLIACASLTGALHPQSATALDTNGDGASDVWQARYGITSVQLSADDDGDGMTNLYEAQIGTAPNSSASAIRPLAALSGESDVQISWQSVTGIRYQIEYAPSLTAPG